MPKEVYFLFFVKDVKIIKKITSNKISKDNSREQLRCLKARVEKLEK